MRVYVHGNCQAPAIAGMLREARPDWDVTSYEVFGTSIIEELDRYVSLIRAADIVISQPIHDGYRNQPELALSWVRDAIKPGSELVVFPSMFFDGQLVGCRSLRIPAYGMPYHDVMFVHMIANGTTLKEVTKVLSAEDLYPEKFILQEIQLSIDEMLFREIDEEIDVPLSPFLQDYACHSQIFHVINHPMRLALAQTANQILRHLGCSSDVSATGREYLSFPSIPVCPSVRRLFVGEPALPLGWAVGDQLRYHVPNMEPIDVLDYQERAAAHLREFGTDVLLDVLADEHVRPFLARAAEAGIDVPGIGQWQGFDTAPARVGRR